MNTLNILATLPKSLLTRDSAKIRKGQGEAIVVQYLAPTTTAGGWDVCVFSSAWDIDGAPIGGCEGPCLFTSGLAGIIKAGESTNAILQARIARTLWMQNDLQAYLQKLAREIALHARRCSKVGVGGAIRLNGTSDLNWNVWPAIPATIKEHGLVWYEYTKDTLRAHQSLKDRFPHTTLSWSGVPIGQDHKPMVKRMQRYLQAGGNVAAVISGPVPDTMFGFPTLDGDASDRRYNDPPSHVAVLSPKGEARKVPPSRWGFIIDGILHMGVPLDS